jgi:glutathione S-transferase
MTLYSAVRCPYCVRVRLVLAEKGIEHEVVEIDLADRDPVLRTLNRRNRVPVLVDGDVVLPESVVINEYLEERFPEPRMMPADAAGRALVRRLIVVFEDLTDAYYDFRRSPDALPPLREQLRHLDGQLAGGYLAGADLTLAEPGYWPWIARMQATMSVDLAPYPRLEAWKALLDARPAYAAELALMEPQTAGA